jgi:hypothetical protein
LEFIYLIFVYKIEISNPNNTIEYRSFNGSLRERIKGNFGNIQSIAYDYVGKNLFYSSTMPNKISVMKLNGNDEPTIKTIINKDLIGPSTIALDVENGNHY